MSFFSKTAKIRPAKEDDYLPIDDNVKFNDSFEYADVHNKYSGSNGHIVTDNDKLFFEKNDECQIPSGSTIVKFLGDRGDTYTIFKNGKIYKTNLGDIYTHAESKKGGRRTRGRKRSGKTRRGRR